jgi:hypothetical protein
MRPRGPANDTGNTICTEKLNGLVNAGRHRLKNRSGRFLLKILILFIINAGL